MFWWNLLPPSSGLCLPFLSCYVLARLILWPRRWRQHISPKRWLTSDGINSVTYQKMVGPYPFMFYVALSKVERNMVPVWEACFLCWIHKVWIMFPTDYNRSGNLWLWATYSLGNFWEENGVENVLPSIHEEFDVSNAKYKLGFSLGCEAETLFIQGLYFGSHLDF